MEFRLSAGVIACAMIFGPLPAAQDGEVRAQWIQAASLQSPESVRRIVATAAASGIKTLIADVRALAGSKPVWIRN
ncbi:MAG TPA: hypothetical protein VIX63_04830 [Vicinamibacterales bacterium]